MRGRLGRLLSAVAFAGIAVSLGTVAEATPIQDTFTATSSLTTSGTLTKLTFGVDANPLTTQTIVLGTPYVLPDFITVTADNGNFGPDSGTITANFTFTLPGSGTPDNVVDAVIAGQTNGNPAQNSGSTGYLTITWPDDSDITFGDGSVLDISIAPVSASCLESPPGENCLNALGPFDLSATFTLEQGPTTGGGDNPPPTVPEPATLSVLAVGLSLIGGAFYFRRKKATTV